MFDKSAIEALSQAESITAASQAVQLGLKGDYVVFLPENFKQHDLEKYLDTRIRARGTMQTSSIDNFAEYTKAHSDVGAMVFVDQDAFRAVGVLNLGTLGNPGHADNVSVLTLKKTAAYDALRRTAAGRGLSQTDAAEFMEDWMMHIECRNAGDLIETKKALAAIRSISIEAARKVESEENQLSASRTAFESVKASGKETLPTHIDFICQPYPGIAPRNFTMRLGVITTGDKPFISLRIIKIEEHEEQMAEELRGLLTGKLGNEISVLVGSYSPKQ